ncbi:type II 3-dehydroquinate dehydratase [Virgibacillus phasianinus]|uniref:3-dehydroquinate dehydratase n=1 Tax=Virgibacillus phasianinus TaxID=2017483 RepID=A0A220U5H3_9BACI|nr:type II 3-dehydroquinate dehydratase [Virgibacillus phasianinus]ASK63222.1 type II 3-dehydroquinate dehydratase [Virgibacillus phasianinus]
MKRLLLVNGPNLNMLGNRENDIYGDFTLADIEKSLELFLKDKGYDLDCFQSNHEGKLIDRLQEANGKYTGIIFNPAAYTHTSIALRDTIKAIDTRVIEVHISNVHNREEFRHRSLLAPVCYGQIVGLGFTGYKLAAIALIDKE